MVYNRRKNPRRDRGVAGRVNAPSEWIWSSRPRHEPLTTRTSFEAGVALGRSRQHSRGGHDLNSHPATKRTYRLRSYVICELCGRRLQGKTRRVRDVHLYYTCEPRPAYHAQRAWFASHPKSLWLREDKVLRLVRNFFARRVFGPHRAAFFEAERQQTDVDPTGGRRQAVRVRIREIERQQSNVVTEFREYRPSGQEEIDRQWRDQLRRSFADLAAERAALVAQLESLVEEETSGTADEGILERLPLFEADLSGLPEELERQLYESFRLQIRYHHPARSNHATSHGRW